jgi:hypothetical protein
LDPPILCTGRNKPNIRIPAHTESLIPMWLSGRKTKSQGEEE